MNIVLLFSPTCPLVILILWTAFKEDIIVLFLFVISIVSDCTCSLFLPLDYRKSIMGFKLFCALVAGKKHPLHHLAPHKLRVLGKFCIPFCTSAQRRNTCSFAMSQLANSGFQF